MTTGMQGVLVAGSGGFIGQALVNYLAEQKVQVVGIDPHISPQSSNMRAIDMLNAKDLGDVLLEVKPSHIFHLAGAVGTQDEVILHQAHVETTRTLLQSVKNCTPSARVVVLGSAAEYGLSASKDSLVCEGADTHPESPYGKSKLHQSRLAKKMADELGLDVVRVRLFNTLGLGQGSQLVAGAMIKRLYEAIREGVDAYEVFDPYSERDFLDVRDVARLVWLVALKLKPRQYDFPIHVASGKGTSIIELTHYLYQAAAVLAEELPIRLIQNNEPTCFIGETRVLTDLLKKDPLQAFSVQTSLNDMWHWYVKEREKLDGITR